MSFVDPGSDRYPALVSAIIHVITYIIGPRYKGTRLYMRHPVNLVIPRFWCIKDIDAVILLCQISFHRNYFQT